MTIELSPDDEKLDPLDDDEAETDAEMLGPVPPPEFENQVRWTEQGGDAPSPESDDAFASLCVQTPSGTVCVRAGNMSRAAASYSAALLLRVPPVLLTPIELELEKLEPLDLLPLLDELPEEETDAEMLGPVLPPELEIPGPLLERLDKPGPGSFASLCVHTPSAKYVFVPGTWIATVRTMPSMRSIASMRSSSR